MYLRTAGSGRDLRQVRRQQDGYRPVRPGGTDDPLRLQGVRTPGTPGSFTTVCSLSIRAYL